VITQRTIVILPCLSALISSKRLLGRCLQRLRVVSSLLNEKRNVRVYHLPAKDRGGLDNGAGLGFIEEAPLIDSV
jgi:hypothetical protein